MKRLIFVALSTALLVFAASAAAGDGSNVVGAAYTISNAAGGNELVVYDRSADGSLTPAGSVPAGGLGTGGGLASQGAVTLTDDGHTILAVNPGSNSVAAFAVRNHGPELLNTAPSGGIGPVSVAVHEHFVYVLNKNNAALATVSGFTLDEDGLTPIAGSTRFLNAGATDAAQVRFSPKRDVLVVTGRSSQRIDTFRVDTDGLLSELKSFDVAPGATRERAFPTPTLRGFAGACGSFRRPPAGCVRDDVLSQLKPAGAARDAASMRSERAPGVALLENAALPGSSHGWGADLQRDTGRQSCRLIGEVPRTFLGERTLAHARQASPRGPETPVAS